MVLHQLPLEVLVAAKVREEQLVLRVQRRALAKDAKVELVHLLRFVLLDVDGSMPILSTPSRDSSNNHAIDDFDD